MADTLKKMPTGIAGFDDITYGGLPVGRTTLICGGPGCGKTLFGLEFIIKGALLYNEPGVFMAFEEKAEELAANVSSLGFDLVKMERAKKIKLDYVHIDRQEIQETGEYDLDGLFIRLEHAIDSIGAKRVVLDTIESLFSGLTNEAILRAELRRLFRWLKDKGVTAVITGEKGENSLTRYGLEEYVSDCVILLDNRVVDQVSTRRLRILKYRGSVHGTNEFPFIIDTDGFSVMPITSVRLGRKVSVQRISTGVPGLDVMMGKKGYYRSSSILVSGSPGTGKTSIAASFANATCKRGEKCLFFAFEESPSQILRNMRSIGMDLSKFTEKGLLQFHSSHPTEHGLEMHLVRIHSLVKKFQPKVVIVDPITNFINVGMQREVKSMLMRLIDLLQLEGITCLFTALNIFDVNQPSDEIVSSLVDTWVQIRDIESDGERNKTLYIMKSRGMAHSNQLRELLITNDGIKLVDIYLGADGIMVGSAREQAQKLQHKSKKINAEQTQRDLWARDRQKNYASRLAGK